MSQGCACLWFKGLQGMTMVQGAATVSMNLRGCKQWSWLITLGRLLPSLENMGGELLLMVASVELGAEGFKTALKM